MRLFMRIICALLAITMCCTAALADGLLLDMGDSGDEVTRLQERLIELGLLAGEPTGVYDEATRSAVLLFQEYSDLFASGIADELTLEALYSDDALDAAELAKWIIGGVTNLYTGANAAAGIAYDVFYEDDGAVYIPEPYMPAVNTEEYSFIRDNGFISAAASPLSTFSAETDTASWALLRKKLLAGEDVEPDAVRIEEMLNYFSYDYGEPTGGEPFGVTMELSRCPWNEDALLLQLGLQAKKVEPNPLGQNIVFLIDISGSMDEPDKLPLVKRAFGLLLETLGDDDTVSVVTYASGTDLLMDGLKGGDRVQIAEVIADLYAHGWTNGGEGLRLAYETARCHFIEGGNNRIIMATDGDINVGESSEGELARLVMDEKASGVALTVLGFGQGNIKDNKMQELAQYGGGSYHYIDTVYEARRALITETGAAFDLVAGDVKLQLDFNPARVGAYRLIGYENRLLEADQFDDDSVGGGELGSGHRVTVLYEILTPDVYEGAKSRYTAGAADLSKEWFTLSVRCRLPGDEASTLFEYPFDGEPANLDEMSDNMRFAAAVAEVGMLLRNSEYAGSADYDGALTLLRGCGSVLGDPFKEEFLYIVDRLARGE